MTHTGRTPKEQLGHLIALAEQGEAQRAALAGDVMALLEDWPADYPPPWRAPFLALLDRAARDSDTAMQRDIAARIVRWPDAPLELLNALYFSADAPTRADIVTRNGRDGAAQAADGAASEVTEHALVSAARAGADMADALARLLNMTRARAEAIARDDSAETLAIACKGAHVTRAGYSAVALLGAQARAGGNRMARLKAYDAVPQGAAERILAAWRAHSGATAAE